MNGHRRAIEGPKPRPDRPVGRVFTVLRCVGEAAGPATLSDIARSTGLPKSTVHRLLAELHHYDMVGKDGDRYHLGKGARLLAASCGDGHKHLRRAVKPLLAALHEKTHYFVAIGVAGEWTVQFVDMVYGCQYTGLVQRIEEGSTLHTSAEGKVLLAFDSDLAVRFGTLARPGRGTPAVPPALHAELSEVRRRGVAVGDRGDGMDITVMAVPVFAGTDRPIAALSLGGYRDRFNESCAYELLRLASRHARLALRRHVTVSIPGAWL